MSFIFCLSSFVILKLFYKISSTIHIPRRISFLSESLASLYSVSLPSVFLLSLSTLLCTHGVSVIDNIKGKRCEGLGYSSAFQSSFFCLPPAFSINPLLSLSSYLITLPLTLTLTLTLNTPALSLGLHLLCSCSEQIDRHRQLHLYNGMALLLEASYARLVRLSGRRSIATSGVFRSIFTFSSFVNFSPCAFCTAFRCDLSLPSAVLKKPDCTPSSGPNMEATPLPWDATNIWSDIGAKHKRVGK